MTVPDHRPNRHRTPSHSDTGRAGSSRQRTGVFASLGVLAAAVVSFTRGWTGGELTIDGPGVSMWLRIVLKYWNTGDGIPAWIPELWAGTPMWDLYPTFHLLVLLPLAGLIGPDEAVKLGAVAAQVAAAWGAFVLARSILVRTWPAMVAGLLYGIHPLFASHGALTGHEPSVWVFAATPWLVWSLSRALRREGARYVAMAGLVLGFALLMQTEHAFSLLLICSLVVAVEMARARRTGAGPTGPGGVLFRAGAVAAIGLGAVAHWLFPFLKLSRSFVLTPPEDVRFGLEVLSGALGRHPGALLRRPAEFTGTYDFEELVMQAFTMDGAYGSGLYLSWVALLLTGLTAFHLSRRRQEDGTLSAILLASVIGVWMSMGTVPLASGGLAREGRVVALILTGLMTGLLVGGFLRQLQLRRWTQLAAVVATLLLFAAPYFSPIIAAQRVLPLLSSLRYPRLYPLAALGVSLGAAYALSLVQPWAAARRPRLAPLLSGALGLTLLGVYVLDVHPYRSYYSTRPPESKAAYGRASQTLAAAGGDARVATAYFGDPLPVKELMGTGRELSVGWPHPLASKDLWRLTNDVMFASPRGFRNAALGLSGTAYFAHELPNDPENQIRTIEEVALEANPGVLPLVRAYDRAVVVEDGALAPEMAVMLSRRSIGVVGGGGDVVSALGPTVGGVVGSSDPCDGGDAGAGALAAEVATACALHNWVGVRYQQERVTMASPVGGAFLSPIGGLRGVSVWLDRLPGATELALHELAADGRSPGRQLARSEASDIDENAMAEFRFDPIADSAGRRYVFLISCPRCDGEDAPKMMATGEPRNEANLVAQGRVEDVRAAAFAPIYESLPAAEPSATSIRSRRAGPGRWRIDVSGSRPSLVVVAESHFPGWNAWVDGERVPVLKADGAFLGVPVGPGSHDVRLEYRRSRMVPIGRAVTALTLLLCIPLLVSPNRRSGRNRLLPRQGSRISSLEGHGPGRPGGSRPRTALPAEYGAERQPGGARHPQDEADPERPRPLQFD